jgi:hypothetical protein
MEKYSERIDSLYEIMTFHYELPEKWHKHSAILIYRNYVKAFFLMACKIGYSTGYVANFMGYSNGYVAITLSNFNQTPNTSNNKQIAIIVHEIETKYAKTIYPCQSALAKSKLF